MTTAATYRALLAYEREKKRPSEAERAGMQSEIERLTRCKSERERPPDQPC